MATSTADVNRTLKGALFETLSSILSPIHDVRTRAEQQITVLEVTDEFGVHLAELTLDQNAPLAIRQLASVLLRQYVESHWSPHAEKFRSPETTAEAKARIRSLLPMGLQESISKLRSTVAYAISAIAHWDWPESWPELFDLLMVSLMSENSYAVHGAMRALTEVSRDVSDNQMPQVAPVILPEMLKIFTHPEKYSVRTRGRAVEIFTTCAEVIAAMSEYNKASAKTLLFPILPQFAEALVRALTVPDGVSSDCGLKKDVLNSLKILIVYFSKQMAQWLPHILSPVWNSLTESANLYIKTVVNYTEDAKNPVDSDGEAIGFENLVFGIFDFVISLVESPRFKNYVKNGLDDLLYYVILYMQITEEQITMWMSDTDRFVEDEEEDSFSYSVRVSSLELLSILGQEFEEETAISLCTAITRHLQETNKNTNPYWWKTHEACMVALGNVHEIVLTQVQSNSLPFNLIGFMETVVIEDLSTADSFPFLCGRCLCTASQYSVILSDDLLQRFLEATVRALNPLQSHSPHLTCINVSGVRAVYEFCKHLKSAKRSALLMPYLALIISYLLDLSTQFVAGALSLVLQTIAAVLAIDENVTISMEPRVTSLVLHVFMKYNSDPVMVSLCEELISELCAYPACRPSVQQRILPSLVSVLQSLPSKVPLGLQAVALDILRTLVRSHTSPIPETLINQAFPAAIFCVMHSDDNSALQNGGECLRAYISVASDQIAAWRDESGHTGLDYVINAVHLLLDTKRPETAAAFVGSLVSMLIHRAGPALGEKAEQILRAVLSKMQQAESLSVTQNLVLIFAQLCRTQLEHVISFLSGVPGPTGKSALEFVLVEWCLCHHLFFGAYDKKVSAFSLANLLEHSIKNNDLRLQSIQVKGDLIVNNCDSVKTRSKSRMDPHQWTEIPLLVKIYKILVQELMNLYESNNQAEEHELSDTEDDFDETRENNVGDYFSQVADCFRSCEYEDYNETEVDPDIAADPLYSMNFKIYLLEFLQTLSQHPCYSTFTQHHTNQEKDFLTSLSLSSESYGS